MASWSAENATKAYLQALKMGKREKELSEVELLAALAAGNNSQLMVMASAAGSDGATAAALICASWQTGGRAICILHSLEELAESRKALGRFADFIEFVVGDAWKLLASDYKSADFVLIDCKLDGERERAVFPVAQRSRRGGVVVVGYNALHGGGGLWSRNGLGAQFLPIGEGLLVGRIPGIDHEKKSGWIFEVDELTGEEHFYKINSSYVRK